MPSLESFLAGLSRVSFQAALLTILVLVAQAVFRRKLSPRWGCALWWLVALRLLLPISPESPVSIFNALPSLGMLSKSPARAVQEALTSRYNAAQAETTQFDLSQAADPAAGAAPLYLRQEPQSFRNASFGPGKSPEAGPEMPAQASGATSRPANAPQNSRRTLWPERRNAWPPGSLILFVVWLAGVLMLGAHLLRATLRLRRSLAGLPRVTSPETLGVLDDCKQQMGVSQPLPVFETDTVTGPALCGFVRPRLLLPQGFATELSAAEQRFVFLHELAHVKRRDVALNWILTALQIVHWFNPLLWFAFARFRSDRELACDALALERAGAAQSEAYGRTILRLLQGFTQPAAVPGLVGILEDPRQLHRRIAAIADFNPATRGRALGLTLLAALSVVALTDANDGKKKLPPAVPLSLTHLLTEAENRPFLQDLVWQVAPKGTQDFGGIEFHVDGLIQLQGKGAGEEGRRYRERIAVPLIETNRVGEQMVLMNRGTNVGAVHLIAGTAYDTDRGNKIAELIWRYADGSFKRTPIQYGVHVRDWWRLRYEEPPRLPYPHSQVVWRGSHPDAAKWGKSLRLYRVSLANPEPGKAIRQLEFLSAMARPSLFIAALTLDPLKPGERPDTTPDLEEQDADLTGHLQLTVRDADSHSIEGAQVEARFKQNGSTPTQADFKKTFATDASGLADVLRPNEGLDRLEIAVSKDGYGTRKMIWDMKAGDTVPPGYTIKLKAGIQIGGVVVDPDDNPVAGATVAVHRIWRGGEGRRNKGEESDFSAQKSTTDAQGRWAARNLPLELLDHISLETSHPDYIGSDALVGENKEIEKQLRERTYKLTLKRGLEARGRVTDDHDRPTADATVWAGMRNSRERQQTTTEADGRFVFRNLDEGNVLFSAAAKGRKPDSREFKVQPGMEEIVFRLEAGSVIRARVQNESGEPISGVRVVLEGSGNIGRTYEFSTTTDENGRLEWDGAPNEPMQFYFGVDGYEQKRNYVLKPDEDNLVTLRRRRQVQGQVLDADTGQPVTKFRVAAGRSFDGNLANFYPDWPGLKDYTDPTGKFALELGEEENNAIQAAADDYSDQTQLLPEAKEGMVQVTLRLKPSKTLEGLVVAPDGRPVPGASVAIARSSPGPGSVQLMRGRLRSFNPQTKLVTSDDSGRYRIPSPPEDGTVVAVSDLGFAAVPLAQTRSDGGLVLQPFGRIEGELKIAGAPGAGQELLFTLPDNGPGVQPDFSTYKVSADGAGRFVFEQVPPGKVSIVRLLRTAPNTWRHSHNTEVNVEPGRITHVTLGDTGAVLRGQVRFETPPAADVELSTTGELSSPRPQLPPGLSPEEIKILISSPEWKERWKNVKNYAATVNPDGSLAIDSIPPGSYTLRVTATQPGSKPWEGKTVAQGEVAVTVPDEATPASPIVLDEIVLKPVSDKRAPQVWMPSRP
jgi:beta-lactamase regulating signal transducer with metallopeptidase domain